MTASLGPSRSADPRLVLATALAGCAGALASPRPSGALALAGCAAVALLAGGGWRRISRHALALAWALGAVAALLQAGLAGGEPLARGRLLGHAVALSRPGAVRGALLLARVLAATLWGAWLAATAGAAGLAAALAWARVPPALLDVLLLAQRYRHVLGEALSSIRCAQELRLGYAGARRGIASAGVLAGALACRAVDQATATAQAMQLRGDSGAAGLALPPSSARANLAVCLGGALALGAAALALRGSPAW